MLFLVILVIALGWAGWFWAWGRDRYASGAGVGLPLGARVPRNTSALSAPRTASMARQRRREVLVALAVVAMLTFLLARSWSAIWALHLIVDIALVVYAWAAYTLENGRSVTRGSVASGHSPSHGRPLSPLSSTPRMSFQPIIEDSMRVHEGQHR